MRMLFAGIGLLSLLICIAIMAYLMSMQAPELHEGAKAQQEAAQLSGHDQYGMAAMNSYGAESYPPSGQFRGIQIKDVTRGGPMDSYYGLRPGDVVLQIGGMDVTALGEYDMAKAELDQAYQEYRVLTVLRNGNQITLPAGGTNNPLQQIKIQ